MQVDNRVSSYDLLTCFFAECEKRFRFLEQDYGYTYLSGLAEYRNNYKIIVPYSKSDKAAPFIALTRYELGDNSIEILYGEENYVLDVFVYINPHTRLSLEDLILAKRRKVGDPSFRAQWLTQPEALVDVLAEVSKHLKIHGKSFLPPSEKLVSRALTIRGKIMEETIRISHKNAIKNASLKAAQAFLHKEYRRVIDLLTPFIDSLDSGDLKKLKLACKHLEESVH